MSVNKVFLVGRLGADPVMTITLTGTVMTVLRIATNVVRGKGNKRTEKTTWHRVVCFGKCAENVAEHKSKGDQICVEGAIENNEWTDQNDVRRYSNSVVAYKVTYL